MVNHTQNLDDSTDQRPADLTLVRVARAGDVEAVKSIIEASAPSAHQHLDSTDPHFIFPSVLNEARVWNDIVERDYENVYSWYEVSLDCRMLCCFRYILPFHTNNSFIFHLSIHYRIHP